MATARRIRTVAEHHIVYHWIAYEERRLITRHTKHTGHNARAIHPSAYLPSIITLASICLDDFQRLPFSWYRTPINKQSLPRYAFKLSRETPLEKKKRKQSIHQRVEPLMFSSWRILERATLFFFHRAHDTLYSFSSFLLLWFLFYDFTNARSRFFHITVSSPWYLVNGITRRIYFVSKSEARFPLSFFSRSYTTRRVT